MTRTLAPMYRERRSTRLPATVWTAQADPNDQASRAVERADRSDPGAAEGGGCGQDTHRVLPDGGIDIIWSSDGRLIVAGPDTAATFAHWAPGVRYVGMRFDPGHGPAQAGADAEALRDGRHDLAELWGDAPARRLADRLMAVSLPRRSSGTAGHDPVTRTAVTRTRTAVTREAAVHQAAVHQAAAHGSVGRGSVADGAAELRAAEHQMAAREAAELEAALAARAPDPGLHDPLAPAIVAGTRDHLRVGTLAQEVGLSERQLLRRSRRAFGYGPMTLARILRLQDALRAARLGHGLASVAAMTGYADQAHLAREVRALTGVTATHLLTYVPPR
ncbi:helix-turn-helix transcriptional regulator [Frankia sp. AiPa1]|uniref:helix-turn-helix transcriptional regulator n=1 Tax=Frankia sp. AiPa1 TaxID=573492 RepID=UPI00202B65DC|nr:helix-turn-helix transcriptional regulator [Frankia sp. AiPa1]MCL9758476.1 helix-turn-helix transcriptional regulator [Frankia sp. AiPa1]